MKRFKKPTNKFPLKTFTIGLLTAVTVLHLFEKRYNPWVQLAQLIPWSEFEEKYAQNFGAEVGPPVKSFRLALGALIIKEKLGISDRETVEQIRENPYLQYFIGQSSYSNEVPFVPSLLVHFQQRISAELVNKVNRAVPLRLLEASRSDSEKKSRTTE